MRWTARGVMVSSVTRALIWVPLAASFVIGLAAVVRMATPVPPGGADITGAIHLPEAVTATIVTLFALAALVFFADVLRRSARRRQEEEEEGVPGPGARRVPGWLQTLTQLLSLVYFAVLAYLLWRGALPLVGGALQGGGAGAGGGAATPPREIAPPFITWTFAALALAAGVGALAVALWVAFGERVARWWEGEAVEPPPEPLATVVEESLGDLRAEADPRRAIIRCYARFERVAGESGLARPPWSTPMEFMREALGRLPVPRAAVPTLTGLFELARFSDHPLGAPERDRALAALDEIRTAIDERPGDAAAP